MKVIAIKNAKGPHQAPNLIVELYDDKKESTFILTVHEMNREQCGELRDYLMEAFRGIIFRDTDEIKRNAWIKIIEYKENHHPPINVPRIEFNNTIPKDCVKFSGLSISQGETSLMLITNALLKKDKKSVHISLGIKKISEKIKTKFLDHLDAHIRTSRYYTDIPTATKELREAAHEIICTFKLIPEEFLDATLEGHHTKFGSMVRKRNAGKSISIT